MSQLNPDQYAKLSTHSPTYGVSYGLYWDKTNSQLCLALNDAIVARIDASGITADLEFSGEALNDILVRGASSWDSVPMGGDATIASTGDVTVTDVTVGSDAQGDILYKSSAAALARLAKGTVGQFLKQNSGATAPEWVSHKTKWPFRVPAASGIDTDGYNGALAGCDQALDVTNTDPGATYCQVYDDSVTAYAALETASADDFVQWQLFPTTGDNANAVFFGYTIPFCQLYFDMSATVQTYTGDGTTWKYWDGNAWSALTVVDYTDATAQDGKRSFGRDGSISFLPPADWAQTTVNGVTGYFIQCVSSGAANISQVGITNSVRHKVASPTKGFVVPFQGTITTVSIRDEAGTVHSAADVKLILVNFTTGEVSDELTFPQDQRNETWTGLTLAVTANDILGVLITQEDGTNEIGPFTLELGVTLA